MNFSSKILEDAVREFSSLPGVGQKTALRFALYLVRQSPQDAEKFSQAIGRLKKELMHCKQCYNISDRDTCEICADPRRDQTSLCVVESIRDIMAIENTQQYKGLYHVLGGIISPMEGIGPADLQIDTLVERIKSRKVQEVILALSTTMEGDTTNFYIYKKVKEMNVSVSTLARGVAVGDELEYADEVTLGRSIRNRTPYEKSLSSK